MASITFELKGADGAAHSYVCHPHPGGEGTALMLDLMGIAGEPLARIIESKGAELIEKFLSGELSFGEDGLEGAFANEDISTLIQGVEWSQLARDLRSAIALVGGAKLFMEFLKYTHRDGIQLGQAAYDIAYQQNYGELLKAVAQVVQVNGFLGFIGSLVNA
ncbi:MAG: hypothetical protein ACNA8W_02330 [Bradymonadaceae bacterium]